MPRRHRYAVSLTVFEVSREDPIRTPTKIGLPKDTATVQGRNVDDVLDKARAAIRGGMQREIRSLAMGRNEVVAYVYPPHESKKDRRTMRERDRRY